MCACGELNEVCRFAWGEQAEKAECESEKRADVGEDLG
jgi:hypothetical protein